jgi:hypothetical protein
VGLRPSAVEFSPHHHFYKLSRSWLLGGCRHSCLLQLACLFTVLWGIVPPPLFSTQGAPPSLLHVFFAVVYYSVSLFSLGGGRSVQVAMLIWPKVVCGSTAYCLPCGLRLPKQFGHWHLAAREPSWFLRLT